MVKILLLTLFISSNAFALSGQVIALDAPLFSSESTKSKIVQYVRKGDDIYLHPAAAKKRKFTKHAPKGKTEEDVIEDSIDTYNSDYQDPLFGGDIYFFNPKSRFYQTQDHRGRTCYILRHHVRIIFEDIRELSFQKPDYDDTDYRLKEPLPKKYPLLSNLGYRGMVLGGFGQHNHTRIPVSPEVDQNSASMKFDLESYWLKNISFDKLERMYFGAMVTYTYTTEKSKYFDSTTNYTIKTDELLSRVSIGPILYYDAWKYQKRRLSTFLSFQFNLFQHKFVEIEDKFKKFKAEYSTTSISPVTGLHYSVNDFYDEDYDLVAGITARYNFPTTYKVAGSDTLDLSKYESTANIELSINIGLKSDF